MNSDSVCFVIFEKWYKSGEWYIYGVVDDEDLAKNYQTSSILNYHEFKYQRTLKLN